MPQMVANQGWAILFCFRHFSLSLCLSLPPTPWTISLYMYKISLFRFICCSGFMGFNFFRKLRCNIRCQFNCQHCKQVSGLSLVYLHLHHFLHRLQDSSMVFGAILHHVWSLCNHFEANDIVGVLAGSPVCFLIFSSPDLRNDMPHLLFAEVDIYTALSNTQQMLHCFFSPHEQYSTTCLLWYFAILNLDYPIPKIFVSNI